MSYDSNVRFPELRIEYPGWVRRKVDWLRPVLGDRDRTRVAIDVARENVLQSSGGPFGCAIFEERSGKLIAVGMNRVEPLNSSCLHAEVVAIAMAQTRLMKPVLEHDDSLAYSLYASCEPCPMCLGAILWSGITRVVWSALHEDAARAGFDTGPLLPALHDDMRRRGIELTAGIVRDEGRELLDAWRTRRV